VGIVLLFCREMIFRKKLDLSVLTERRVLAPYGLAGGEPGMCGRNTLVSTHVPLPATASIVFVLCIF
jgi:N-methylhydantoinase B/oxoprolinase/acetone carboxylase alpha subunit